MLGFNIWPKAFVLCSSSNSAGSQTWGSIHLLCVNLAMPPSIHPFSIPSSSCTHGCRGLLEPVGNNEDHKSDAGLWSLLPLLCTQTKCIVQVHGPVWLHLFFRNLHLYCNLKISVIMRPTGAITIVRKWLFWNLNFWLSCKVKIRNFSWGQIHIALGRSDCLNIHTAPVWLSGTTHSQHHT